MLSSAYQSLFSLNSKNLPSLPLFRFLLSIHSAFPLVQAFSYSHVPALSQTSPCSLFFLLVSTYLFKDLFSASSLVFADIALSPLLLRSSQVPTALLCRIYQPLLSFPSAQSNPLYILLLQHLLVCGTYWFAQVSYSSFHLLC